jgi:formate/nitrite transporter FocA (FNT family)
MGRLVSIASIFFCFEIGLFLVFIPWSELWNSNFLLNYAPWIRPLILHWSFRTAVTLLGGFDILIGISESYRLVRSFRDQKRTTAE